MTDHIVLIQPSRRLAALNMREIWAYRELLLMLALRDVKLRYKQTALGVAWVVLQPLVTTVVFTIIFGNLGKLPSDQMPYMLFSFAGLLPWTLFSQSVQRAGNSLVAGASLITKVYFPRAILPIASTGAVLIDVTIMLAVAFALMWYFRTPLGWHTLLVPVPLVLALVLSIGVSLWLSALSVRYRDFVYMLPFLIQAWLYASPVAYSTSLIPEAWQSLYALNPMVGVIELFRWALLGRATLSAVTLIPALVATFVFVLTGAMVFRSVERSFADVI